jgi:hypothetical protein
MCYKHGLKEIIIMKMNREDVELLFYKVIKGEFLITEFEEWIYSSYGDIIATYFDDNFYFELISINYKSKFTYD